MNLIVFANNTDNTVFIYIIFLIYIWYNFGKEVMVMGCLKEVKVSGH